MGVHSGKFGVVNGEDTVRQWSISDAQTLQTYVASNTQFGTGRQPGVESWSGSFQKYGYLPGVMPGSQISFVGYEAPDNDVSGDGMRYSGNALVSQLQVNWDWGAGAIINSQVDFAGHLALTAAVGAEITDSVFPTVPPVTVTKIEYSTNDSDYTELDCLVTAQWTLTSALQAYVNSCTIVSSRLWTGQKSGPIDWTLAITQQDNARPLAKGTRVSLKLYINATEFFLLKWARLQDYTGITVDRETGAIISQTLNFGMDGFNTDASTVGQIVLPDLSVWWPTPATTTAAPTTT